jgi:hypothetical protein
VAAFLASQLGQKGVHSLPGRAEPFFPFAGTPGHGREEGYFNKEDMALKAGDAAVARSSKRSCS